MIILPNMGLVKWDSVNDNFSHVQLAANFQALDEHDHTTGKGTQIPAGGIAEGAIGPSNLQAGAFSGSSLASNSIETSKLKDGAVTSSKLKPTVITKLSTSNFGLTAAYKDVPGLEFTVTPLVASKLLLWVNIEVFVLSGGGNAMVNVLLDGVAQLESPMTGGIDSVTQTANVIPLSISMALSAALHTVKVQVKGSSTLGLGHPQSHLLGLLVAS